MINVYTQNGTETYDRSEEMISKYGSNMLHIHAGFVNPYIRMELCNQPIFKNLIGPMYDGVSERGEVKIRYEDQYVNNMLSM